MKYPNFGRLWLRKEQDNCNSDNDMNSWWAKARLPIAALLIFGLGVLLNFAVSSTGIVIPALWLWPLLVLTVFLGVIWAVGGNVLVRRVWYWIWGAPWDAAGWIADKSSRGEGEQD